MTHTFVIRYNDPMDSNNKKRLILLASAQSYRGGPFDIAAKKLGVEIIFGQDVPLPLQNDASPGLRLDYRDIKQATKTILKFAKKYPIDGILGLDDSGTLIAASTYEALGIPHNSIESALAARDKHIMRKCFLKSNIPSPPFEHHFLNEDIEKLSHEVSYPCVIKPTTLSGSRGVMRANSPQEFIQRINRLRPILANERCDEFLIEEFIPGQEYAIEGIMDNGKLIVLALFDKPDPLDGPFFEETIYVTPSRLPQETQQEIIDTAENAAKSLGLMRGPIHAEIRFNDKGPWMVEIAGRSIGGLCSQTLHFKTKTTLEELILRQLLDLDLSNASRKTGADGVMMIPIPEAGLLKRISGIEEAKSIPFINDIEITARLNYSLVPLPEGNAYLGFIFASARTPEEVESALRKAYQSLKIEVAPEIKLIHSN